MPVSRKKIRIAFTIAFTAVTLNSLWNSLQYTSSTGVAHNLDNVPFRGVDGRKQHSLSNIRNMNNPSTLSIPVKKDTASGKVKDAGKPALDGTVKIMKESSWNDVQTKRTKTMRQICTEIPKAVKFKACKPRQFLFDHGHNALYCFVPKVGCSTWKNTILSIKAGKDQVEIWPGIHKPSFLLKYGLVAYRFIPAMWRREVKKFIFVRHPFERLISAYREKFGPDNHVFHKQHGRKIIRMFRKNPTDAALSSGNDVTFQEFIQYVIHGNNDPHWSTYFDGCCPCQFDYDYIGKLESFTDDSVHILHEIFNMTLTEAKEFFPALHVNPHGRTNETFFNHYLGQLLETQIDELNEHFKWDFEMFGYKPLNFVPSA